MSLQWMGSWMRAPGGARHSFAPALAGGMERCGERCARGQSHEVDHDQLVVGHADSGLARTPRLGPAHRRAGTLARAGAGRAVWTGPSRQRACPSRIV